MAARARIFQSISKNNRVNPIRLSSNQFRIEINLFEDAIIAIYIEHGYHSECVPYWYSHRHI